MRVQVPLEIVGAGEAAVADLAPEGTLPRVLPHMGLEVVLEVEAGAADVAHEGAFLSVCLDVTLQLRASLEGEVAA